MQKLYILNDYVQTARSYGQCSEDTEVFEMHL